MEVWKRRYMARFWQGKQNAIKTAKRSLDICVLQVITKTDILAVT